MTVEIKPVIRDKLHAHAHHVYHYGEHGCAVSYAIHEFFGLHVVVLALSGILLAGMVFVAIDMVFFKE